MNLKAFFTSIRPIFGGQITEAQVDGINTILAAWKAHGDGNPRHLAYILATAKHETAHTMQPVRETLASTDAKAKEILTKSFNAGKLTWVKRDYWSSGFFGRGFVQITHKGNYEYAGNKLGVATHISVGHAELMVTWPSRAVEGGKVQQHTSDYWVNGQNAPEQAWGHVK
jgi:predicted chitinase